MKLQLLAVVDSGEIVSYRYGIETKPNLPQVSRCMEVPEEQMTNRKVFSLIGGLEGEAAPEEQSAMLKQAKKAAIARGVSGYRFPQMGWNALEGDAVFAFSNCYVTKKGIQYGGFCDAKGYNLYVSPQFSSSKENAKMRFLEMMKIVEEKQEVFLPILLANMAALLNRPLGKRGSAPAIVLWLGGRPGSGKTELAVALGSFVNKNPRDWTEFGRKVFSAFGKPKNMVQSLAEHHGIMFLLDDVKGEKVQGQRDNSRTCVDICIRSVNAQKIASAFLAGQQALTEMNVDAGAIITGEEMKIYESSVARIVYLDIDDFVNSEKASAALMRLQDEPYILCDFMVHFLRYLLEKAEDVTYWAPGFPVLPVPQLQLLLLSKMSRSL